MKRTIDRAMGHPTSSVKGEQGSLSKVISELGKNKKCIETEESCEASVFMRRKE